MLEEERKREGEEEGLSMMPQFPSSLVAPCRVSLLLMGVCGGGREGPDDGSVTAAKQFIPTSHTVSFLKRAGGWESALSKFFPNSKSRPRTIFQNALKPFDIDPRTLKISFD